MMTPDKKKNRRFYQIVGEKLRTRILRGEFPIGGRLPPERDLSEHYDVGRAVIRDAIIMLELQGLVEVRQGSGVYITQATMSENTKVFDLNSAIDSKTGPFEMIEARQLIESNVARFAANRATAKDIAAIEDALSLHRISLTADIKEDADKMLHLAVAGATQNNELVDMVETLWTRRENNPMWKLLHARITVKDYRARWVADHERIFYALQRKEADAAFNAMWTHLENVKNLLHENKDLESPMCDGLLSNDKAAVQE